MAGWSMICLLRSMFPISFADNSFVNPDDSGVAIQPSCSTGGEFPSIGRPNPSGQSSFSTNTALIIPGEPPLDNSDASGVAIQQIHECLPSCSTGGEFPSIGRPNPSGQSSFSTDTALFIPGEPPLDNSDASLASLHQTLTCLTNGEAIGESPIRELPRLSTYAPASSGSGTTNAGLSHHVIDIDQQQSRQAITGTETSTQTRHPTRGFSEPSTSYSSSSPLLFATNSNSFQPPQFITGNSLLPQNSETFRAINIELQRTQPLAGHLPDPHVINSHEVPRDQPFKLGKTFLGLTFQAVLAVMIFHFQGSLSAQSPSPPSASPTTPSIPVEIVGASMAVGFTFTLIGILVRNPYPTVANISEYAGVFSAAFGFFVMTEMLLPESFSWTVWPTGVVLLVVFAFVLAKMR